MRFLRLPLSIRRLAGAEDGIAAIEMSLLMPILLGLFGLLVFAGQGFELQRRVELTTGTITNLVASAPLAQNVGNPNTSAGATYINQSDLDADLALAAEVMYPYGVTDLRVVVSQVNVNLQNNIGTVWWSEAAYGGTPLRVLSTINLDPTLVKAGMTYLIIGQISYTYQPTSIFSVIGPITFNSTQILAPRNAVHIEVNWGY